MDQKKRKIGGPRGDVDGGGTRVAMSEMIVAEMRAQMARMQGEIDGMKDRLSRAEELEATLRRGVIRMDRKFSRVDALERRCRAQESRCRSLEARCDFLLRTARMLVRGGEWEYSDPILPADSFWIERGLDLREAGEANAFLQAMKERAFSLRHQACFNTHTTGITLGETFSDHENGAILAYNPVLLPHWIELTDSLQMYCQNSDSRCLEFKICNMELPSSVINMLPAALQQNGYLNKFELKNIAFENTAEGIDFVVETLNSNQSLGHLTMENISINSSGDTDHLLRAIAGHGNLQCVGLKRCFGSNAKSYGGLRTLLASQDNCLTEIDFGANNLWTLGRRDISDYISTNPPLEKLNLRDNHLIDDDVILIADALKHNSILEEIDLGQNFITNIGRNALQDAIFNSATLNLLEGSNHTCDIKGVTFRDIPVNNGAYHANRARKIYTLLSLRNRMQINVPHLDSEFDEDYLKLAPNMLGCVRHYRSMFKREDVIDLQHPLSIRYEILRGLKMPSLFARRRGPTMLA